MSKSTNELVEAIDKKKKKPKKGFKKYINALGKIISDIAQFVFFATAIAGGYVLLTQDSDNMRVVGGILLAGAVYFFASRTINK